MKKIILPSILIFFATNILTSQSVLTNPSRMSGTMSSENYDIIYGEQEVSGVYSSENNIIIIGFLGNPLSRISSFIKFHSPDISNIEVYPNPFNSEIVLNLLSSQNANLNITLLSSNGQDLQNWNRVKQSEYFTTRLKFKNILPGNYFLRITEKDKLKAVIQLVKQ